MWPFKRKESPLGRREEPNIQALIRESQYGTSFDFENTPGVWVEYDFPLTFSKRLRVYCAGNLPLTKFEHWKDEPEYMPRQEYMALRLRLMRVVCPDTTGLDIKKGLDPSIIRIHKHYIAFSRRVGDEPDIHTPEIVQRLLPIVQELAGWDVLPDVIYGAPPNAGARWAVSS